MKSLLIKLIIFSLPVLAFLLPLDLYLSANLKKSTTFVTGEYTVWNDIYGGKINADVLIYGASRALNINPEVIKDSLNRECYNMGINGLGFRHIYLRHVEFMKLNTPPKIIIVSIDIGSLAKGKNLFQQDQFLPYMLCNRSTHKYLRDVNSFSFFEYYFPLIRYCGRRNAIQEAVKCSLSANDTTILRKKGYMESDEGWNEDLKNAQAKYGTIRITNDPKSIELFDSLLAECKKKNISVILVNSPEYIDGQLFVENRDEIINIYKEFSRKYGLLFLDYSSDNICYDNKYFYNAQHLNKVGSAVFNLKLFADLRNALNNNTGVNSFTLVHP